MQKKHILLVLSVVLGILTIPFVAQFTGDTSWSVFDFVVAGMLLTITGLVVIFVMEKVQSTQKRILICLGVLAVLALIWAELAVGIFGTPFAGS